MKLNLELLKKELVIDKVIDFVLIFVGLYAAIAVQRWQDRVKEGNEYRRLLADFREELRANQGQRAEIVKSLGPVTSQTPGKVLGSLQKTFDEFQNDAAEAGKVLACLGPLFSEPARGKARKPAMTRACKKIFEEAEASADDEEDGFRPVDLAPHFRSEVHQVYLANGIKVFENKSLAVKIGEAYTRVREVERGMTDIEKLFNDGFMQREGEQEALTAQLEETLTDGVRSRAFGEVRAKLADITDDFNDQRYAVVEIHKVLESKAVRVKEMLIRMDAHHMAVIKEIDEELTRRK